jgi:hypothetical protein
MMPGRLASPGEPGTMRFVRLPLAVERPSRRMATVSYRHKPGNDTATVVIETLTKRSARLRSGQFPSWPKHPAVFQPAAELAFRWERV